MARSSRRSGYPVDRLPRRPRWVSAGSLVAVLTVVVVVVVVALVLVVALVVVLVVVAVVAVVVVAVVPRPALRQSGVFHALRLPAGCGGIDR